MLTIPRYARSMLDDFDDFYHPLERMERYIPRLSTVFNRGRDIPISIPTVKGDKFYLSLDFHQFEPSDITVKVEDDCLLIKGKKEKKGDGMFESREYVQRFNFPRNVIADRMTCNLDKNGYLRIEAPVREEIREIKHDRDTNIPVEIVHKPSLTN
ncbi:hypothetical protein BLOT_016422 [Blomia tropicalis]|nr:hypothetical protein BLOT_016422 [Blomia tropicalis]